MTTDDHLPDMDVLDDPDRWEGLSSKKSEMDP